MAGGDVLKQVAQNTDNDILLLVIVMSVVLLIIAVPFYKAISKSAKEKRQQELDRDKLILNVIKDNTKINAGLKALLENNNANCRACRAEQMRKFDAIGNKIDSNTALVTRVLISTEGRGGTHATTNQQ